MDQNTKAYKYNHKLIMDYLKNKNLLKFDCVLEVDKPNKFTCLLKEKYSMVDNCSGDFDVNIEIPDKQYSFMVFTSVIEHLFDPLYTLLELKKHLKPNGKLFIACPKGTMFSPKYYWHFHEMTEGQLFMLLQRAGFKNIDYVEKPRYWGFRIGFRPLLRRVVDKYILSLWRLE